MGGKHTLRQARQSKKLQQWILMRDVVAHESVSFSTVDSDMTDMVEVSQGGLSMVLIMPKLGKDSSTIHATLASRFEHVP